MFTSFGSKKGEWLKLIKFSSGIIWLIKGCDKHLLEKILNIKMLKVKS
jgi:hypothetical protein